VVFYCRSGDRSTMPAEAFRASGWEAYTIEGGLTAWAEAGQPLEPEDGEVVDDADVDLEADIDLGDITEEEEAEA